MAYNSYNQGYRPPGPSSYSGPSTGPSSGGYAAAPPYAGGAYPPPSAAPGYGAPPASAPGYGAPPASAPGYGAPPSGAPGYGASGYGAPGYGAPGYGAPGYGAPGYGAPGHGGPPPGVSQELWHWFLSVDSDRNGRITGEELQRALLNGNWSPFNAETCRLMIGMFDTDKNGTIDVHEFSALWKYIQDWKACFDRFDTDRSGNIDTGELSNAFKTFGYNLSMNFCVMCVRVFDRTNQRSIKFDDFIQCCVMLKSLTDKFKDKDKEQRGVINIYYEEFLRMVLDNTVVF